MAGAGLKTKGTTEVIAEDVRPLLSQRGPRSKTMQMSGVAAVATVILALGWHATNVRKQTEYCM